jgi:hypothetical protein
MTTPILAHPGQRVTHHDRPRLLGPTEHLLRCSCCSEPTIVLCEGEPGAGVLCEGCLMPRGNPTFIAVSNFL